MYNEEAFLLYYILHRRGGYLNCSLMDGVCGMMWGGYKN